MWTLDKVSTPTWEKEFATKAEAVLELRSHICDSCMSGKAWNVNSKAIGGMERNPDFDTPPADPTDADSLLSTTCGLEYEIYEAPKGPVRRFVKVRRS